LALLGEEAAAPFDKVWEARADISSAAEALLGSFRHLHEPGLRADAHEWRNAISGARRKDDKIGPMIDEAVKAMEAVARGHLGSWRPRRRWPRLRLRGSRVYLEWPGAGRPY
jgi:hypothetical protein